MALANHVVNTKDIPSTISLLESYLPSVLYSTCFNDSGLPFAVEAQSTEIGHLFEHILLEYLCYFKLLEGVRSAEYSGVTQWNWEHDPWGVFHITINTGCADSEIFKKAMHQSILLLQIILNGSDPTSIPLPIHLDPERPVSPLFERLDS